MVPNSYQTPTMASHQCLMLHRHALARVVLATHLDPETTAAREPQCNVCFPYVLSSIC
jgi:hypothetical protein